MSDAAHNNDSISILLGVTGSIAAYRSAELVRLIKTAGWDLHVVMTEAATRFVGPMTFQTLSQNPVLVDQFDDSAWRPEHILASEKADVFLIAPCTANVMAKLAHGLADDLLTSTALACPAPLMIAPAMNVHMWNHPATQANLKTLVERGAQIVDVEEGDLACGYRGAGRMAAPNDILKALTSLLNARSA